MHAVLVWLAIHGGEPAASSAEATASAAQPSLDPLASAPGAAAPSKPGVPSRRRNDLERAGWALTGIGGVLLVAGLGTMIWDRTSDEGYATIFVGLPLLGGALGLTGIGLPMVLVGRKRPPGPPREGPRPRVGTPGWVLTGVGGGLMISGYVMITVGDNPQVGGPLLGTGAAALGGGIALGVVGRRRAIARGERTRWGAPGEIAGWTLTGIGAAMLVSGGITMIVDSDQWGIKRIGRLVGGPLITVGAVFTAVGVPLGVRGRRLRRAAPASIRPGPVLSLAPLYLGFGGGFAVHGRF